ncbi:hypothetical protein ES703_101079 [subsurface metagenome]
MKCTYHPDVETELRCGKCGKPICPKCLVQAPVGARCPECGRLQKLPTFHITKKYYLKAIGTATGMAFACGAVWRAVMPFSYFNFLLAAGFGYAIGEVISRSVNRKRGRGLALIAGVAVVVAYLVSIFPPWGLGLGRFSLFGLLAVALGVWIAVNRLR